MVLFDRVNGAQEIPVDFAGARWSGDTACINPAVVGVEQLHHVTKGDRGGVGLVIVEVVVGEEAVEEGVDGCHLGLGDPGRGAAAVEEDAECGLAVAVGLLVGVRGHVQDVQLQVHAQAVHRVFRPAVPAQLARVEG